MLCRYRSRCVLYVPHIGRVTFYTMHTKHFVAVHLCAALLFLAGAEHAYAFSGPAPAPMVSVEGVGQGAMESVRVLVGFKEPFGAGVSTFARTYGGVLHRTFSLVPAIALEVPAASVPLLKQNPFVSVVEEDVRVQALEGEAEELAGTWGVAHIGAGEAHSAGYLGAGIKVAVVDTGIDHTHPDLAANYRGGWDFVNDDDDPVDDNGHGTHVAGMIAAVRDGAGVVGVAPQAELYAVKVLDASGSGYISDIIAGLDWAVAHGMQVTNNSYGTAQNPGTLFEQAFTRAEQAGIVNVAAAGNSGTCGWFLADTVGYPARYPSTLAVGAVDTNDTRPCFSSTGNAVALAAPGVSVRSTVPGGTYASWNGTSMATPHVAGASALLIGVGVTDTNGNGRVNDEVRAILQRTARDLGATGRDTQYGFGLVNVPKAISDATGAVTPALPLYVRSVSYALNATRRNLTVTVGVQDGAGTPIAGAAAKATVRNTTRSRSYSFSGTTSALGTVTYTISNAPNGTYTTTLTSLTKDGYVWDGVTPSNTYRK